MKYEPKYDIRSIFYNKFGALQSFWLPTKNIVSTGVKSENYNATTIEASFSSAPSYQHINTQRKDFK